MRKKNWLILLCAGLLPGFGGCLAAMPNGGGMVTIEADSTQDSPYLAIEDMPRFPGGDVTKWLAKNTRYPKAALERKAEGKVFVQFVIEKDGRVTNVKVLRPVDPDLDREAVRVVSSMPRWKPGKQRGKFVRVPYMVPINFRLKSGKGEATAEPDVDACVLTGNEVRTPLFPGNWNKWIEKRIREEGYGYSDDEGIMVRFVVETDGRITKIQTRKEEDVELGRAAAAIIAEIGNDMSAFPDSQHICSWAGLSPGNNESAGKRKSTHINKGNPYLKSMLCEVGWVISGKRTLYLSGWYWRVKQRKGAKRATIALARKLLALIYTMLKTGTPYNEECFEIRRKQSERKRAGRMVNELQKLGYFVVAPD